MILQLCSHGLAKHTNVCEPRVLTIHTINLNQVFSNRLVYFRTRPVESNSIGLDACERHSGAIWNFNPEDVNELLNRLS